MRCKICGNPITLNPSAEERASKDVTGKSAGYYRSLFTEHSQCAIDKRNRDTVELIRRTHS